MLRESLVKDMKTASVSNIFFNISRLGNMIYCQKREIAPFKFRRNTSSRHYYCHFVWYNFWNIFSFQSYWSVYIVSDTVSLLSVLYQLRLAGESFMEGDDVRVDMEGKVVSVSKIFSWYKEDFGGTDITVSIVCSLVSFCW